MPKDNPLTIVIFGATGDLYGDKLAKALFILFKEGKLPTDFKIIAFARRDFIHHTFRSHTSEKITKRDNIDHSNLDKFLEHIEYFKGDFFNQDDYKRLYDELSLQKDRSIIFHIATPYFAYKDIFQHIKDARLNLMNNPPKILIEKPFGESEQDAKSLHSLLHSIFDENNVFHVDHYLAKENSRGILEYRHKDTALQNIWNGDHIEKIKIAFHESNLVGTRGASYDKVGAFRDVGENHMLQLLALVAMKIPRELNPNDIRLSRTNALSDLYIDNQGQITKGQYEGYKSEPGVSPESNTETFFRVFLKSKDPNFSNVSIELEGGKGLIDMKSSITSTTVSVWVYFKDGTTKEFKIQPVVGTEYNSYTQVYVDAIRGDQSLFVTIDEIIVELRLARELFLKWTDVPLIIYNKGTKPEDIK